MINKALFSSAKEDWETPDELFEQYNRKYNFTLDVCADSKNHKCERYFTKEQDALKQNWDGERCWCNPPYGRAISGFVKKAAESKALTVMLIPARTDTKWFHIYIYICSTLLNFLKAASSLRELPARLRFLAW